MLKKTKTRESVIELLSHSSTPMSAGEIFEALGEKGITLSSIYRTLEAFTNEKYVVKDSTPNGTAIYTLLKENHCHYLECTNCHKKIELNYCPYYKVNKQIKSQYDFTVNSHNVVIFGLCSDCAKKDNMHNN